MICLFVYLCFENTSEPCKNGWTDQDSVWRQTRGPNEPCIKWACSLHMVPHGKYSWVLCQNTHTHTRLTALCPGLPRWAGTRKIKPMWILLKQETVSGSGISWAICKSAPRCRHITMPVPHHSVFYRPDALPAAQPTVSKHYLSDMSKHLHYLLLVDHHAY